MRVCQDSQCKTACECVRTVSVRQHANVSGQSDLACDTGRKESESTSLLHESQTNCQCARTIPVERHLFAHNSCVTVTQTDKSSLS